MILMMTVVAVMVIASGMRVRMTCLGLYDLVRRVRWCMVLERQMEGDDERLQRNAQAHEGSKELSPCSGLLPVVHLVLHRVMSPEAPPIKSYNDRSAGKFFQCSRVEFFHPLGSRPRPVQTGRAPRVGQLPAMHVPVIRGELKTEPVRAECVLVSLWCVSARSVEVVLGE